MIFEIANLNPKLNTSGRFGLKIAMFLILMKFGTQIKSNILIMNILIGIDDFDPKFAKFGLRTEMCSNFYEIWYLEQIEHADYEYCTWNWWSWPKTIDLGKFGTHNKPKMLIMNIIVRLERSHDYRLRMIIGSQNMELQ